VKTEGNLFGFWSSYMEASDSQRYGAGKNRYRRRPEKECGEKEADDELHGSSLESDHAGFVTTRGLYRPGERSSKQACIRSIQSPRDRPVPLIEACSGQSGFDELEASVGS
jgi:hypothetical protein